MLSNVSTRRVNVQSESRLAFNSTGRAFGASSKRLLIKYFEFQLSVRNPVYRPDPQIMAAPFSTCSLAGWIPRPALFNASKHGTSVKFSEEWSVAERETPEDVWKNAVVYTAQPVPVGEVWRATVLSTSTRKWHGGLVSGWVLCSL